MTEEEDRNSERRARSEGAGRDETRHKDVSRSCLLSGASMDWEGRGDGRGGRLAVSGSGFGAESPLRAARSGWMHSL